MEYCDAWGGASFTDDEARPLSKLGIAEVPYVYQDVGRINSVEVGIKACVRLCEAVVGVDSRENTGVGVYHIIAVLAEVDYVLMLRILAIVVVVGVVVQGFEVVGVFAEPDCVEDLAEVV